MLILASGGEWRRRRWRWIGPTLARARPGMLLLVTAVVGEVSDGGGGGGGWRWRWRRMMLMEDGVDLMSATSCVRDAYTIRDKKGSWEGE